MNLKIDIIDKIKSYTQKIKERRIETLFGEVSRTDNYILTASGITLDFSKTNVDNELLSLLISLLTENSFMDLRNDLFNGNIVNKTENQPAVHTLIRSQGGAMAINSRDIKKEIHSEHERMSLFCKKLLSGKITGVTGKAITEIVNIGIGGSQTGPEMVVKALKSFKTKLEYTFPI